MKCTVDGGMTRCGGKGQSRGHRRGKWGRRIIVGAGVERDLDLVLGTVVEYLHETTLHRSSVNGHGRLSNLARRPAVADPNVVGRGAIAIGRFVAGPTGRNARHDEQPIRDAAQPEDAFDSHAVHPGRGASVPGPTSTAGVRSDAVDVGGDDIRLDLVALHRCWRVRMINRVEQPEEAFRCFRSAKAQVVHTAACVYWPPFSRMPGG
jgi:hypothetical protein